MIKIHIIHIITGKIMIQRLKSRYRILACCAAECYLQSEPDGSTVSRNADVEAEEPLPPGWATAVAPNGRLFYIDHNTKATTWV